MSRIAEYLLVSIITLLACFLFAKGCGSEKEPPQEHIVVRTDTMYVRDTVTVYKPSKVTRTIKDTMRLIVRETQIDTMHDTVFVYLPQESIVWQDDRCIVYAHGINPQVDSVTHFNSGAVVTRTVTGRPKRWGIGVSAGYGMSKDGLSPYIGLGISYNIIRF